VMAIHEVSPLDSFDRRAADRSEKANSRRSLSPLLDLMSRLGVSQQDIDDQIKRENSRRENDPNEPVAIPRGALLELYEAAVPWEIAGDRGPSGCLLEAIEHAKMTLGIR
jgi:hypothetical protein